MTPEEQARQEIDRQLVAAGWMVQDRAAMDIYAGPGVAIREFPLRGGEEADYLLYADGEAIGVVEAKPEGFSLLGVETQSAKYTRGLPDDLPAHRLPLPFSCESTGRVTQFTNLLDPDPRSREVFSFHRPAELLPLVRAASQPRGSLRAMPPLEAAGMWPAQVTAIANLERSLAANRPRSLLQMATGSSKTFTAVTSVYRLIRFGRPRLVLPETVLLAQVVKSHKGRRLVDVTRRVVFGTVEAVADAIAATRGGTQINTSYIARR